MLTEGSISAPRLTAEVLLSYALQQDRAYLYAHSDEELTELAWIHYGRYLHERLNGKPTQYIVKRQEFYGRDFLVTPDVLIPRPETEHLIEAALKRIRPNDTVLDVGCGAGPIGITLALETQTRVYASDISLAALAIAAENARVLNAPVQFVQADLAAPFAERSIDLLVSNPPYIARKEEHGLQREVREYEPHVALFAGQTGLEMYQRLIPEARRILRGGGYLILELGYQSVDAVEAMLAREWSEVEVASDLAGFPRALSARLV